ncbi:MAG: acryloyl-CoA reductase [Ktedonobacteraceae bacterium]|nr:acryloyl-CoA reductase [Ktedonobacteraceae bacterium]
MAEVFRAFVVAKTGEEFSAGFKELTREELPAGEVLIRVAYSSVNYKDGLASIAEGKVVRNYPLVPGIDMAGIVAESSDARFKEGDPVIATSYELGMSHSGGYSEYARVPAGWVVPLPGGLSLKEAMIIGTAGLTVGLSLHQMEKLGLKPENGPVLVTGATGGVGSVGISILKKRGYTIAASTGKASEHAYLQKLGATEILGRDETAAESRRPMEKERWAGSLDSVGGSTLSYLIRTTKYGGSIAAYGNTGGGNVATTIYPFILRGINLLGIESANCPMELRQQIWQHLASDYRPDLETIAHEVAFEELPQALATILKGGTKGRVVVRVER